MLLVPLAPAALSPRWQGEREGGALTDRLYQGRLFDAATDLVYHGDGHYYDPQLGLRLQPSPTGGPPTLPQALNRYAVPPAQSVVGQVAASPRLPGWAEYTVDKARQETIQKVITTLGEKAGIRAAFQGWVLRSTGMEYLVLQGERRLFPRALMRHLEIVDVVQPALSFKDYLYKAWASSTLLGQLGYLKRAVLVKLGLGKGYDEVLARGWLPGGVFTSSHYPGLRIHNWRSTLKRVPRFNVLGVGLEVGASIAADVAIQWWYDRNDPYLTPKQKKGRLVVAGWGGVFSGAAGVAGSFFGGPWVGFWIAAGVEFIWQCWATPRIYEGRGLVGERRLRPLSGGG